jgi:hypothetical protein
VRRALALLVAATLAGGCDGGTRTEDDPGASLAWETLAPMSVPRTEVAAAAAGGTIVVAGGFDSSGATVDTVELYDVEADEWSEGPPLPAAVDHAMAASDGETVYVFGGYDADRNPTAGAFAFHDGGWIVLDDPMPETRAAGGAAYSDRLIYVAGGIGPDGLADRTMVLNLDSGRWTVGGGLIVPREHLAVTALDGVVYAVGGRIGGMDGNLNAVERLVPTNGRWEVAADLPTARGGLGAAAGAGLVIAAGGEEEPGTFAEVEAYDPTGRSWSALPDLPTPRHGLGVVVADAILFVIAGGPEPGLSVSGVVDALDLRTV